MISAIDPGGCNTKYLDARLPKPVMFPSAIGINDLDRNLKSTGEFDFEWEFEGLTGFAGSLALRESEYVESRKDDSKAHFDAKLRTLIALHQYGSGNDHQILVGQPIETHTEAEKQSIKKMYIGTHDLTVNGRRKIIHIKNCEVGPEGAASGLLIAPAAGTIRIIDIGSGSVNFATITDRQFINKSSFTLPEGMESKSKLNARSFGRQIAARAIARKWDKSEVIYITGGGAEEVLPHIQALFPLAVLLDPDPFTTNVRGLLMIARRVYSA